MRSGWSLELTKLANNLKNSMLLWAHTDDTYIGTSGKGLEAGVTCQKDNAMATILSANAL